MRGLGLKPGELVLDCGANVGEVTEALARTGADVHAFEPNPYAFAVLRKRVRSLANVTLHERAVLDRDGVVRLYLHRRAREDQVAWSVGSSILPEKGNVDAATWLDVEAVDLGRFVLELERPVAVLKLDVEGAELSVLERLLDSRAIEQVRTVLVELHDRRVPELRADTVRLLERLEHAGVADRVRTDWR